MYRTKLQVLGLVIMMVVIMTTLLSCSKKESTLVNEIDKLKMTENFDLLTSELNTLANNIQFEQEFFKKKDPNNDYDTFAGSLSKSFEQSSDDFGKVHQQILSQMESLQAKYSDAQSVELLDQINVYQIQLSELLEDMMQYHYMVLESELLLTLFNETVMDMMAYLSDGNTTSIKYNVGLQDVMADYSKLLSVDSMSVFNSSALRDEEVTVELLNLVSNAKSDINKLETLTEVDKTINQYVLTMFDFVEQSITSIHEYMLQIKTSTYLVNVEKPIDDDAKSFYEDVMLMLKNPLLELENMD